MRYLILAKAFAGVLLAFGNAVPTEWTVRIGPRSATYQADRYHGDALALKATLTHNGIPFPYVGRARLYAQTNGMGSSWFDLAPAEVTSNVLTATWLPAFDTGADMVDLFLGGPSNYQAHARIRFLPSPGPVPNAIQMPLPVLDFDSIEVINAPWYDRSDIDAATNEILRAALAAAASKQDALPYRTNAIPWEAVAGAPEIPSVPVPVAPSTAPAAAGKPADAKATGDMLAGKLDGAAAYPAYEDKPYNTGDVVSFKGRLFRCGVDGSTESPSFYPYPSAQWDEVTLDALKQDALSPAQMAAANSGATAAKVTAWDGYAAQIAQKADAADLRYRMVLVDDRQLVDRAWNDVDLDPGTTATTLTLPEAVAGRYARDMLVVIDIIEDRQLPFTLTLAAPSGETARFFTDDGTIPQPDSKGKWLYSISEMSVGKFAVSCRKVVEAAQGGS